MSRWAVIVIVGFVGIFMFRIETKLDQIQGQVEDLNRVVKTAKPVAYNSQELECLARNIYYEAGTENIVGKYAVGHITLNRLKTGYWGTSICSVVYAKAQFSWTLKKRLPKPDPALYAEAESVAWDIIHGHRVASLDKSLFYHADYIPNPNWADPKEKITQIGRHIFYTKARNSWLEI
jgi:spore germination cell wall hydrolase CwlJ-like protein